MDDPRSTPPQPEPIAESKQAPAPARPAVHHKENIKETIESILIAFILAFVFRAFVVEAFVIPSGSMAPTLLGAHMRLRCQDCGYDFTVNYPTDTHREDVSIPSLSGAALSMHCPNCGYKVQKEGPDPEQRAWNTPVHYGDRILVLKYLYLFQNPQRWDVVVFKSPYDPSGKYVQNYIKRLVGKPGETVMLLDGDIYVCPNEKRGALDGIRGWPWQVQTKPRIVQDALWRIVYDNDYYPQNTAQRQRDWNRWVNPWQQADGSGWETGGEDGPGRVFAFSNLNGAGMLRFNKDANRGTYPLTDWLPYSETMVAGLNERGTAQSNYEAEAYSDTSRETIPHWYVSDLKVQFSYERRQGDGPVRASLTKLGHRFVAEVYPTKVRMLSIPPSGDGKEWNVDMKLDSGPTQVEFSSVDYQVTLRVNGRDVIQTRPEDYGPNVEDVLDRHHRRQSAASARSAEAIRAAFPPPTVELGAERQVCTISHLSLWRDIYYTPAMGRSYSDGLKHGGPESPITLKRRGETGDLRGERTDNEYFVLGDNSILSGDARGWTDDVDLREGEDLYVESGRVPERFMLGKAFFVYWPAGFRPLSESMPGIVPNFGKMRFIH